MRHYNYSHIPATFITFLPISHMYTYKEEKQRMCSFTAVWFLFAFSLWHMCTHILNILVFMPFSAVMYSALLGESPRPITSQMGSYVILPECSRSALGCALSWTGPVRPQGGDLEASRRDWNNSNAPQLWSSSSYQHSVAQVKPWLWRQACSSARL